MKEYHGADSAALTNLINELKSRFDHKLLQGESFEDVKKVYMQIKEIESHLNVIDWQYPKESHKIFPVAGIILKYLKSMGNIQRHATSCLFSRFLLNPLKSFLFS